MKMAMPNVHKCGMLFAENDKLQSKVKKLSAKNKELLQEMSSLRDRIKADEILKQKTVKKNSSTQTQVQKTLTGLPVTAKRNVPISRPSTSAEKQRADKLMQMHNNLMKRYEKEVKLNADHSDTIDKLNMRIGEQEKLLTMTKARLHESEKENERLRTSRRPRSRSGSRGRSQSPAPDRDEIRRERDELRMENSRLRKELSGLDKNFFDELEDLKFSLQQSARLNQEYEKTLRSMCSKFNVPFPHSDNTPTSKR